MIFRHLKKTVFYAAGFIFYRILLVFSKQTIAPCWSKKRRFYIYLDKSTPYHVFNSTFKLDEMVESIGVTPNIVFDVGANCGLFSAILKNKHPQSEIYSIEPSLDLIPAIQQNCGSTVNILPVAISDSDKLKELYINPESQQTNSFYQQVVLPFSGSGGVQKKEVQCRSINSLCKEYNIDQVDVLKIDVQGAESEVLEGATEILSKVKILFLESTWLEVESVRNIFTLASNYGFRYLSVINPVYMGADIILFRDKKDITEKCLQNVFDLMSSGDVVASKG